MVDRDVFAKRIDAFERTLRDLRAAVDFPREAFLADRGRQAQVERWCQVLVEISLDLAHHLIADRGWESPDTYRGSFEELARRGVIDDTLAGQLADWAGLRNLLVHLYLAVDHGRLYDIVTTELDQLERYARAVSRAVDG